MRDATIGFVAAVIVVALLLAIREGVGAFYDRAYMAGYCDSEAELQKVWMEIPDRYKHAQDKRVNPDFKFATPPDDRGVGEGGRRGNQ